MLQYLDRHECSLFGGTRGLFGWTLKRRGFEGAATAGSDKSNRMNPSGRLCRGGGCGQVGPRRVGSGEWSERLTRGEWMMLTPEQIREFDEQGFVKGPVVLDQGQVEKLRSELDAVMEGRSVRPPVLNRNLLNGDQTYGMQMSKTDTVVQIVNMWMASDAFLTHARNPVICEEVAQLCRTDTLRIWHDQVQYKPPVTGGPGGWHQDFPAWPVLQPPDLVSAWVALDDAVVENGCMWMVPGSHRWGNQKGYITRTPDYMPSHREPDRLPPGARVEAVPFEIRKGQVGYHHCLTWHGSPPNRSTRKRRAIAVHYMPAHIRYEPAGSHVMRTFVEVQPGEILAGEHFPVVFRRDEVAARS